MNIHAHSAILGFSLLRDGLTRVHPGGCAAIINTALDNGVGSAAGFEGGLSPRLRQRVGKAVCVGVMEKFDMWRV